MQEIATIAYDHELEITPEIQNLINTIQKEIEQGKTQTFWNVGKIIKEYILEHSKRADYGEKLFVILAEHLKMSSANLYLCVRFFEQYPNLSFLSHKLSWSHFRTLLAIPDMEQRRVYEEQVITDDLSVRELKEVIKNDRGITQDKTNSSPLVFKRGKPWVYRLKSLRGKIVVDLGFRIFVISPVQSLKPEDIVHVEQQNQNYKFKIDDTAIVPHYTYRAYLREILDGDTIWVDIDLGFNTWTTQKLRLRGINSEGIETPLGKTTKEYVENRLKGCEFIAVKTYWRDKFTRYLADIFYSEKEENFENLVRNGTFLNQELLDKDLAKRY